jgi:hypothetical protein
MTTRGASGVAYAFRCSLSPFSWGIATIVEIATATSLSVVVSTAKDKCATASCSNVAIVEALVDDGA